MLHRTIDGTDLAETPQRCRWHATTVALAGNHNIDLGGRANVEIRLHVGGRHARLLKSLARVELLILDDWGLATLTPEQGRDILEIVEDRHNRGSTIVTSQLPVDHWHEAIANPTIADAILDRLVHNAHRLILNGESLRKTAAKRAGLDVKQDA